jgi:hypothetical protein
VPTPKPAEAAKASEPEKKADEARMSDEKKPVVADTKSKPIIPLPADNPREAKDDSETGSPVKSRLKKIINLFGG